MIKISENFTRKKVVTVPVVPGDLQKENFPAGRSPGNGVYTGERTLTSNMTGHVTLTGSFADLQFSRGYLKRIARDGKPLVDRLESSSYITTSLNKFEYRNESAFAFESGSEYGLRTLQLPKKNEGDHRIITDFIFNRETGDCLITVAVDYPVFETDEIITEAAPFEFRLKNDTEKLRINSDKGETIVFSPEDTAGMTIKGKSFNINTGPFILTITYRDEYNSGKFSSLDGLAVRTETFRRKKYLLINPGGSYTPAPAGYYSGISEQFCMQLGLRQQS